MFHSVRWPCWGGGPRVLSGRGLCVGLDHSYRGVLPSVVCLSVIVQPRPGRGPGPLGGCAIKKRHIHTTARELEVIQRACWKRKHVRSREMWRGSVKGICSCGLSIVCIDDSPEKILHQFAISLIRTKDNSTLILLYLPK